MRLVFLCALFVGGLAHAAEMDQRLDAIRARLPGWNEQITKLRMAGEVVSYPLVTYTVLENFTAYAKDDLAVASKPEAAWLADRVTREIGDMEAMATRLNEQLARALSGKSKLPRVPRWDGKRRPTIAGPSFVGADGRPIFFVGYGHFQQVRDDIEKFPAYGVNIVQHGEMGPAHVFPKEDVVDDAPIDRLIDELDRAAKAGVAVDFLMSPHYVPEWIWTKWPHLRKARRDFIPWSVYAPEGRALVKRFCDYVIPKIKDKPALFSICLSNEPNNAQEPDEFSIAAWRAWLQKRHGDIATLNGRWKTSYASFAEVPPVNPQADGPEPRPGPAWCDYVRWNQEYFADFHAFLAKCVKDVAPEIPVHIKATTWHLYRAENIRYGDDPTLFDAVSDINGNDSVNLWSFKERGGDLIERGTNDFAQGWRENAIGYALQRSTKDAPVFNSENHLIFDRETRYVDPTHIYSGLWMGAIHGQSATTLWVWEREKSNPRGDLAGSMMERPGCAEALGIACHDLNRAAREITAIQKAPADVEILQCNTAAAWDGAKYHGELIGTLTELSFTGLKIGFITERQLEQGQLPKSKRIYVTNCTHVSDAAVATLRKYQGEIVMRGKDCFAKNEYDQPRAADAIPAKGQAAELQPALALSGAAGKLQWQLGTLDGATIVNVYNASHDPQAVHLSASATDVLSGETLKPDQPFTLAPMGVRLFRCEKRAK
jgi:hypothetical protein